MRSICSRESNLPKSAETKSARQSSNVLQHGLLLQFHLPIRSNNSSIFFFYEFLKYFVSHVDLFSSLQLLPIFFDYPSFRNEVGKKKVELALNALETYLKTTNTKYVAADSLTIADIGLVTGTLPLEAIGYHFDHYPLVTKWYRTFKCEHPELWQIAQIGVDIFTEYEQNPPDLSKLNHPLHPARKVL